MQAVPPALSDSLGPPVAIALDGATRTAVFQYARGVIIGRDGHHHGLAATLEANATLVALPQGVAVGDELYPWDMSPSTMLDPSAPSGRTLVATALGDSWFTVRQSTIDSSADVVTVRRTSLVGAPNPQTWVHEGYAAAAIDHGGRICLSFADGRMCVLDPGSLLERLNVHRNNPAYLVSAIAPGWCLVSANPHTDQATPPVDRRARVGGLPGHHIRGSWHSRVEQVDDSGTTEWSVDVPFPVLQPPVFAGGARRYLVGKGLAAVDGGRILWQKSANMRLLATCFGDGTLALVGGFQVRILGRDGRPKQTLTTPDRSNILTLPSIGSDGALYVGTVTGVYVAR